MPPCFPSKRCVVGYMEKVCRSRFVGPFARLDNFGVSEKAEEKFCVIYYLFLGISFCMCCPTCYIVAFLKFGELHLLKCQVDHTYFVVYFTLADIQKEFV